MENKNLEKRTLGGAYPTDEPFYVPEMSTLKKEIVEDIKRKNNPSLAKAISEKDYFVYMDVDHEGRKAWVIDPTKKMPKNYAEYLENLGY